MVHAFRLGLLWPFSHPNERRGSLSFGHRYCPAWSPPSTWCFQKVIWCASITLGPYSSSYLCSPRPSISLTLHPIAVPPSPTSPSPTQAPSIALMLSMAKLIVHRHVRIAFLRFRLSTWLTLTSRFLIAFSPMSLWIHLHHRHRRTHVDTYSSPVLLCQPLSIIFALLPNTTRGPLLFVHGR